MSHEISIARRRAGGAHRAVLATTLAAAAILIPASARADDAPVVDDASGTETAPSPETHVYSLSTELHAGGYSTSDKQGGMALIGLDLLGHYGPLEGGGLVEGGTQGPFSGSMTGYAAVAGVGYDVTPHLRLSILGELGRHEYSNLGSNLFGPPGVSGSTPYGGGRLGLVYGFGRDIRFALGGWFFVRDDFDRKTISGTYDAGWFAPDPQPYSGTIGQVQYGFTLRLGVEFGGV